MIYRSQHTDMTHAPNLFAGIPDSLPEELIETIAAANHMRIERIVSRGHCSPPDFWYDQPENEWVTVIQGEGVLRFERDDRLVRMTRGSHILIPAHEKHRVEWTAADKETVWLAVFY
jgi:cupin 2 domain-containing protein